MLAQAARIVRICWVLSPSSHRVAALKLTNDDSAPKSANQCDVARRAAKTINLRICPLTFMAADGGVVS